MLTRQILNPIKILKWAAKFFIAAILCLLAIMVIHLRQANRQAVSQLRILELEENKLYNLWTQRLVEQAMLANFAHVDNVVSKELRMHQPDKDQIVVLSSNSQNNSDRISRKNP